MWNKSRQNADKKTGEGNFDDKNASGTVTPAESDSKSKKRKPKKAKSARERLAMADGQMDL